MQAGASADQSGEELGALLEQTQFLEGPGGRDPVQM